MIAWPTAEGTSKEVPLETPGPGGTVTLARSTLLLSTPKVITPAAPMLAAGAM